MEKDIILTIDDMKKISHEIIDGELEQNGITHDVFPLTFVEYYGDYIFNKKFRLTKMAVYSAIPLIAGGFNNLEGNIVIFLNRIDKIEKIENKIFKLAQVCYHEARHSIQQKFDDYSYEGFLRDIDTFLSTKVSYILKHDKYYFEIDANLYGVIKAKEYLKNRYPNLYEKYKDKIEIRENQYRFDYMTYDASDNVERTIQMLKTMNTVNFNGSEERKIRNVSPVLEVFLNDDASFKKISEIVQNDKFRKLDKRIIYAFLSSKSFLEQINMDQLSLDELEIINESLHYTSTLYKKQSSKIEQVLRERDITYLEYLKSQKSLIKKFRMIDIHYTRKLFEALSANHSSKMKQAHMESIPTYLEESEQLISQIKGK